MIRISEAEALLYAAWLSEQYTQATGDQWDGTDEWRERARLWRVKQIDQGRDFWQDWRTYWEKRS
jgi:hypothetical protein